MEEPKTVPGMLSEWLREASVLIAVFGALLYPLFDGKELQAPAWLSWLLTDDGKIGLGWVVGMVVLAVALFGGAVWIEKGRK